MSLTEDGKRRAETSRLQREIDSLSEQQAAAQRASAIVGMTVDEAWKYRERHFRIKKLTRQLSKLDGQGNAKSMEGRNEQEEEEKIARHGEEGDQVNGFNRT
jgi:alkanesulfonate monooxygenase SsuD/methylene tetrahydromethanopterin reductase-like flavin-dependent oxidoreductase (luciferase family)